MPAARLACLCLSLALLAAPAFAQQTSPSEPQSGTLKPPSKQKQVEPSAPHPPPKAAPVPPVQKESGPVQKTPQKTPMVKAKASPAKRPTSHAKPPPAAAAPTPAPPPAPEAAKPASPPELLKGTVTGLPLPRFAALRSDEVNLRSGPGTRYPIEWVYKRRELPVEIEREFEVWRLVKDEDGVKGWVHQATLTGRRSFVVAGAERTLRREPRDDAAPVALLKPGVIGRLRSCQAGAEWCEVQVGEYRGWLRRGEFWGSYSGEAVNP